MSDSSQTLCKIPLHSINLTHLIIMPYTMEGYVLGTTLYKALDFFPKAAPNRSCFPDMEGIYLLL